MPESTWVNSGSQNENKQKTFDLVLRWIQNNRQAALITLGGFVFLVILLIAASITYNKNKENAQKQLFVAQQVAYSGRIEVGLNQLSDIEKNYASRPEADFAIYTKADIYFSQGKYKEALDEYNKLVHRKTNKDLVPYAFYSIAKCYQAMEDTENAIIQIKNFIAAYPEHFLAGQAYSSLGYIYHRKGQIDLARETYEKVMILFPETGWAENARIKLQILPKQGQTAKK